MNNTEQLDPEEKRHKTRLRPFLNLVAALLIGALGNGVWEALVRPGFGWLGQLMNAIASRFDTEVFTSAALDPTPLPSLALLMLVCSVPPALAGVIAGLAIPFPPIDRIVDRLMSRIDELPEEAADKARRKALRGIAIVLTAALLCLGMVSFTAFSIQNKATAVWRAFHANLDVVAPNIADAERKRVVAAFRQMKSREDFDRIKMQLDAFTPENAQPLNWRLL